MNEILQDKPFIQELYSDYTPSVNVRRTIETLLLSVPSESLAGLHEIVLTNVSALSREQKRRRVSTGGRISDVRGFYEPAKKEQAAQIYLFVDTILKRRSPFSLKLPFSVNFIFAEVLFHEIGHHVQYWSKSKLVGKEAFANKHAAELFKLFLHQHYWFLRPFKVPIKILGWVIKKLRLAVLVEKYGRVEK